VLPGLSSGAVDLDAGSFELSSPGADLEAGGGEEGGRTTAFLPILGCSEAVSA